MEMLELKNMIHINPPLDDLNNRFKITEERISEIEIG